MATTLWERVSPWVEKLLLPIVAAAAGIAGSLGTYALESYKEKISHTEKFIDKAMDKNLEARYRLAQYFGTHADTKKQWEAYYGAVNKEYEESKTRKKALLLEIANFQADLEELRNEMKPDEKNLRKRKVLQAQEMFAGLELAAIDDQIKVIFSTERVRQDAMPVVLNGWIYLGQKDKAEQRNGKWIEKTTDASEEPKPGDSIRPLTSVYLRDSAPKESDKGAVLRGQSLSIIPMGETLKIVKLSDKNSRNTFWAQVERVAPGTK